MVSKSPRDSVGGGSSRHFPWSPKAGAIQWEGGGGYYYEFFVNGALLHFLAFPKGGPGRVIFFSTLVPGSSEQRPFSTN